MWLQYCHNICWRNRTPLEIPRFNLDRSKRNAKRWLRFCNSWIRFQGIRFQLPIQTLQYTPDIEIFPPFTLDELKIEVAKSNQPRSTDTLYTAVARIGGRIAAWNQYIIYLGGLKSFYECLHAIHFAALFITKGFRCFLLLAVHRTTIFHGWKLNR